MFDSISDQELLVNKTYSILLDEMLAPVRAEFANSGITEAELDALIEEERQAIWEEALRKKQ
ncbi:MAG TPA: hypothetical protein VFZ34_31905 [Blastocatellia bacterium]|nr:hypothetical protein [Blastocatellia bacterium]